MSSCFSAIRIEGGFFETAKTLKFFDNEKERVSIIYGKNGSGKSTISKAIFMYKQNSFQNEFSEIGIRDLYGNAIFEDINKRKTLCVFNNEYVREKINYKDDALGAVVILGKHKELDDLIKNHEVKYQELDSELEKLGDELKDYNSYEKVLSPDYWMNKMIIELRKDKGWADIDKLIKGNSIKTKVSKEVVIDIAKINVLDTRENLIRIFQDLYNTYRNAKTANKIETHVPSINIQQIKQQKIIELLNQEIELPQLTENEQKIINIIKKGEQNLIEKSREVFTDESTNYCPFCFQEVSNSYKKEILQLISNVLYEGVTEHKEGLKNVKPAKIELDLEPFLILDKCLVQQINEKTRILNGIINTVNNDIEIKINDCYTPLKIETYKLNEEASLINDSLKELENKRKAYNKSIEEIGLVLKKLSEINNQIYSLQIKDDYKQYEKQCEARTILEQKIIIKSNEQEECQRRINDLESEKKSIKIALDIMNDWLKYIFFSNNRLTLENSNNKYYIKSRGQKVRLKNLSVGEKNIIGLCYFFLELLENQEEDRIFQMPYIIVLDDPISSFDFENKVGIYSFLRLMIKQILLANEQSKVIIFTHSLEVLFGMEKLCGDILTTPNSKILANKELCKKTNKHNDYTDLLKDIYIFANREQGYEEFENTIGNTMRKVLEAFSTFVYQKNVEALFIDKSILEQIGDKKLQEYYENSMCRLVLHGDSHMEERTKALTEKGFFDFIDIDEKVRTAKDVIVFLYSLNKTHIEILLNFKGDSTIEKNIINWRKYILE